MKNLIELHWRQNRRIPESFIWHCIDQLGQALGYLHLGYVEGRPLPPEWAPIAHQGMMSVNIMLHYDSDGKPETAALPDVKIIHFGSATREGDTAYRTRGGYVASSTALKTKRLTWDLSCYATLLSDMIWHDAPGPMSKSTVGAYWPREAYSERLKEIIAYLSASDFRDFEQAATRKIVEYIVPLARRKVDELRQLGELKAVHWTKPESVKNVPLDISVATEEVKISTAKIRGPRGAVTIRERPAGKVFKFGGLRLTLVDNP